MRWKHWYKSKSERPAAERTAGKADTKQPASCRGLTGTWQDAGFVSLPVLRKMTQNIGGKHISILFLGCKGMLSADRYVCSMDAHRL